MNKSQVIIAIGVVIALSGAVLLDCGVEITGCTALCIGIGAIAFGPVTELL